MAKKQATKPPAQPSPLTHNPFASLARAQPGAAALPAPNAATPAPMAVTETAPKPPSPSETAKATQPGTKAERSGALGRVVLRRETKHRGGKAVVIVGGLNQLKHFDEAAALGLAQKLKKQLGCGGTLEIRDGEREIVLQGDRAAQVAALLRAMGFRVDGVTS